MSYEKVLIFCVGMEYLIIAGLLLGGALHQNSSFTVGLQGRGMADKYPAVCSVQYIKNVLFY